MPEGPVTQEGGLDPRRAEPEQRSVTLVFSDLAGSTKLGESLDAETLRTVLSRYFDEMQAVLVSYGGVIEKIIGDAIVAVFDDRILEGRSAELAVAAVAEAEAALALLNEVLEGRWGIRLVNRTGVATGPLTVKRLAEGHSVLGGEVFARAEALERSSPHLEALVDEATRDRTGHFAELEDAGTVEVDEAASCRAWRLASVADGTVAPIGGAEDSPAVCAHCGIEGEVEDGRCGTCGNRVAAPVETRRTITAVFAAPSPDPQGRTPPGPDEISSAMSTFFEAARAILQSHGATVETFIGDAVMAVFGLPVRHEDDALRAVRAAHDLRLALPSINQEMSDRHGIVMKCPIGVNTGEVVAGDASTGQRLVTGDTVNVAARLEQAAGDGEVLIGDLTRRLVEGRVNLEPVPPLSLKGKTEPVPAYRLLDTREAESAPSRTLPLVGRDAEMAVLNGVLDRSTADGACRLVTVVGDAGVGKSRLIAEFLSGAADRAPSLQGRCLPYGDGVTLWPIVEAVRKFAGIRDQDEPADAIARIRGRLGPDLQDVTDRLAVVAGLSAEPFPMSELFWAIRILLETASEDRPLVFLVEDVHWAEQGLVDLLGYLADTVARPVVLLCTARPVLLVERPEWLQSPGGEHVELTPLTTSQAAEMIEHLLGSAGIGESVRRRVAEAAEGNPLFVEQLIGMLIDEGRLVFENGAWTAAGSLESLTVPPSIDALLAARLDRLDPEEGHLVGPASVIGNVFPSPALRELIDEPGLTESMDHHLARLVVKQIVDEVDADDPSHRFHHALLRDTAYRGLLKERRAQLHERFVGWADRVNAERDRALEFEEILGYHLEQSYLLWSEIGPVDDRVRAIGAEGARRLGSAGHRAFDRGDMPAAANLLTRAVSLIDPGDPQAAPLLLRSGEARFETGAFGDAGTAFERAIEIAEQADDRGTAAAAEIERLRLAFLTGAVGSEEAVAQANSAVEVLTARDHHAGLARAWRLLTTIDVLGTRFGQAEESALRMVDHAHRAGDATLAARMLQNIAVLAPVGPTPVHTAMERCEDVLGQVSEDRRATANTMRPLAVLKAMVGDIDEARRLYRTARHTLTELGWRLDAALVSLDSGPVELTAGDAETAAAELRQGLEALQEMQDRYFAPTVATYLAEALYRLERDEAAAEQIAFAEEHVDPDDLGPAALWRAVKAKILARGGDLEAADRLAAEAFELADHSDSPNLAGDVLAAAGVVARSAGRHDEADDFFDRAERAYRRKGNVAALGSLAGIRVRVGAR